MISFWISVVPPKLDWTRLSRQGSTFAAESNGLVFPPVKADSTRSARAAAFARAIWAAITRHEIVSPRRNSPSRGVAPTTTPNQRPRISQPPVQTSTPVSSPRHSCHRSS